MRATNGKAPEDAEPQPLARLWGGTRETPDPVEVDMDAIAEPAFDPAPLGPISIESLAAIQAREMAAGCGLSPEFAQRMNDSDAGPDQIRAGNAGEYAHKGMRAKERRELLWSGSNGKAAP